MAEQLAHKAAFLACEAGTIPLISALTAAARDEEKEAVACTSAYHGGCNTDHEDDADSGTSSQCSVNSAVESNSKQHDHTYAAGLAAMLPLLGGEMHFRKPTVLRLASCDSNGLCLSCHDGATQGSDTGTLIQSGRSITHRLAMAVEAWDVLARFVSIK